MTSQDKEKVFITFFLFALFFLTLNIYYFCHPMLSQMKLTWKVIDGMLLNLRDNGFFNTPYRTKLYALAMAIFYFLARNAMPTDASWKKILIIIGSGLLLYLFPWRMLWPYLLSTVAGYLTMSVGFSLMMRKLKGAKNPEDDGDETFQQCEKLIETDMSVNLKTKYFYKGHWRTGYINCVQPQRGVAVFGVPGSGKSFAVYGPFIQQMMAKGFTFYVYDYKYPTLTEQVYNEWLDAYPQVTDPETGHKLSPKGAPSFNVINFKDPRFSQRCNPIHPRYLPEQTDTSEIADIIMKNVGSGGGRSESKDFFDQSARQYVDALIWFLRIYKNGRYCDLPHLIELMSANYEKLLSIMDEYPSIHSKLSSFVNALDAHAMDQLQGQIASAQIPLGRFASSALYWTLSGDEFSLDINNSDEPKIVCVGNDPDRQGIYGAALALYAARVFRLINHPGRKPCAVMLDELPTMFVKDLDQTIATCRSNGVCVILGAQDKSQLIRDFGQDYASVIFNTVGNIFSGQVNGETAKQLSETFGRQYRIQQSTTVSADSESLNTSYQLVDTLPQSRIETLSQGTFFGKIADDFKHKIKYKLFCGEIQVDKSHNDKLSANWQKLTPRSAFGEEFIEKEVRRNPEQYIMVYLTDKYMDESMNHSNSEDDDGPITYEHAINKAQTAYDNMDQDEFREVVEKTIEHIIQKNIKAVIEDNYQKIKADIAEIIKTEFDDKEEKSKAENDAKKLQENLPNPGKVTLGSLPGAIRPDGSKMEG